MYVHIHKAAKQRCGADMAWARPELYGPEHVIFEVRWWSRQGEDVHESCQAQCLKQGTVQRPRDVVLRAML